MPLVSIIVPVHNSERYLVNTINSILHQDFADFELIIVDDGSKDRSGEICDGFLKVDSRIKVFHQFNAGPSRARNKGIEYACGKYLALVDADDKVESRWLSSMVQAAEEDQLDLVCTGYKKVSVSGEELQIKSEVSINSYLLEGKKNIMAHFDTMLSSGVFNQFWNKLYRSDLVKGHMIIDEQFNIGEDFVFNLNYISKCNRIGMLDCALYNYVINFSGLTHRYRENKFQILSELNQKLKDFLEKNDLRTEIADYRLIRTCFSCFMELFHKEANFPLFKKLEYVEIILNDESILNVTKHFKPRRFVEKCLFSILKSRSSLIILMFSWLFFTIKYKIVRH